jgi:hypothetical protein
MELYYNYIENILKCIKIILQYAINTMKFIINTYKYIEKTFKYIGIFLNTYSFQLNTIKIHFYTLAYIEIPSIYIVIPSKNLNYLLYMLQYHYYTLICFNTVLLTLKLSCNLSILHLFVLLLCCFQNYHGTSLFYKNILVLAITYYKVKQVRHIP